MKWLRRMKQAVEDVVGRGQIHIVEALRAQLGTAREAVDVVGEAASGELDLGVASRHVDELETAGDRHRERLVTTLARTMVIPIDREDLFRVSRSIDDVLDDLTDFARELELFGAEARSPLFGGVLDAIAAAIDEFDQAVSMLPVSASAAVAGSLRANKLGNDVRRRYQRALADVLDGEVTSTVLKRRELLRRLDIVGLRLGEAADALADGGLKRGS